MNEKNLHTTTVAGFGDEWERFDQSELPIEERQRIFKMEQAELENIQFSSEVPFWCAVGYRKKLTGVMA